MTTVPVTPDASSPRNPPARGRRMPSSLLRPFLSWPLRSPLAHMHTCAATSVACSRKGQRGRAQLPQAVPGERQRGVKPPMSRVAHVVGKVLSPREHVSVGTRELPLHSWLEVGRLQEQFGGNRGGMLMRGACLNSSHCGAWPWAQENTALRSYRSVPIVCGGAQFLSCVYCTLDTYGRDSC